MSLRFALVLAGFCVALAAQGNKGGSGAPGRPEQVIKQREAIEAEGGDDGAKSADGKAKEEEWENLTPEQRLERGIRSGASNYCRFVAAVRPSRLRPGQSGTLFVTAVLQGSAVFPAPAPLQVTSPTSQGMISLGAPTFHPAKLGTLAAGYLGRPVYDNTAIFEIPITMSSDAQLGTKQAVHVDMKFDLYDGASAQVVGRFVDRATAEVEVGEAADPAVTMPVHINSSQAVSSPTGGALQNDASAQAVSVRPDALGGNVVTPGAAAPVPQPVDEGSLEGPPVPDAGGANLQPLLIGGGALVLLILVLLVRRK